MLFMSLWLSTGHAGDMDIQRIEVGNQAAVQPLGAKSPKKVFIE